MKLIVVVVLLGVVTSVYGQQKMYTHKEPKQDKDDPEVYHVTRNIELAYAGVHTYCRIEYLSRSELALKVKKDGELKLLSKEEIEEQISELPPGMITVIIKRTSADQANMDRFSVVIQNMKGDEIQRADLTGGAPDLVRGNLPIHFVNAGSVGLNQPVTEEVKVFVIDELKQVRHEFIIKPS